MMMSTDITDTVVVDRNGIEVVTHKYPVESLSDLTVKLAKHSHIQFNVHKQVLAAASIYFQTIIEGDPVISVIDLTDDIEFNVDDIKLLFDLLYGKYGIRLIDGVTAADSRPKYRPDDTIYYTDTTTDACNTATVQHVTVDANDEHLYDLQLYNGKIINSVNERSMHFKCFADSTKRSSLTLTQIYKVARMAHYFDISTLMTECDHVIARSIGRPTYTVLCQWLLRADEFNLQRTLVECIDQLPRNEFMHPTEETKVTLRQLSKTTLINVAANFARKVYL